MPLILRKLEESDLEEVVRMQHAAFSNPHGTDKFISLHQTATDEGVATSIARRRDLMPNNKSASFLVFYDTDLKAIISSAAWEIYPQKRTQEQVDSLARTPPVPSGSNIEAWNDFFNHLGTQRRKLGVRPIAILRSIATHPEQQRRGAAKMLLDQFMKEVDDVGLEAYLEASQMGIPLYARFGFVPVFERVFDMEKYGGSGQDSNTVMIRPASRSGLEIVTPHV